MPKLLKDVLKKQGTGYTLKHRDPILPLPDAPGKVKPPTEAQFKGTTKTSKRPRGSSPAGIVGESAEIATSISSHTGWTHRDGFNHHSSEAMSAKDKAEYHKNQAKWAKQEQDTKLTDIHRKLASAYRSASDAHFEAAGHHAKHFQMTNEELGTLSRLDNLSESNDDDHPKVRNLKKKGFKYVAKSNGGWTHHFEHKDGRSATVEYGPQPSNVSSVRIHENTDYNVKDLNELSKNTLSSYVKKAATNAAKRSGMFGLVHQSKKSKEARKVANRLVNISKAMDKVVK